MAVKFYLAKEGLDLTPVSPVKLRRLIEDGIVTGDDLIFAKHLKAWTKARQVKGFRTQIAQIEARNASPDEQAAKVFETSEFHDSSAESRPPVERARASAPEPAPTPVVRPSLLSLLNRDEKYETHEETREWWPAGIQSWKIVTIVVLLCLVVYLNLPAWQAGKLRVTGTVKFNGVPVESGRIQFDSMDGSSPGSVVSFRDGAFELANDTGVGSGTMTVRIWGFRKTGKRLDPKKLGPAMENFKGDLEERESFIPAKFNSASTRQVEVAAGKANVFDFDLEDAAAIKGPRSKN